MMKTYLKQSVCLSVVVFLMLFCFSAGTGLAKYVDSVWVESFTFQVIPKNFTYYLRDASTVNRTLKNQLGSTEATPFDSSVKKIVFGTTTKYKEEIQGLMREANLGQDQENDKIYVYRDDNTGTVYVLAHSANRDEKIILPPDCTNIFSYFSELHTIEGLDHLETKNVESMTGMFSNNPKLRSFAPADWNTGNVTRMDFMFSGCTALSSLDVSEFETSNVTQMKGMFSSCSSLTAIDVLSFDTSQVKSLEDMFKGCSSLTTLDLSSFSLDASPDITAMFSRSSKLQTILVRENWKSEERDLTEKEDMFFGCTNLKGGQGTGYSPDHATFERAIIDEGDEKPGYFTQKKEVVKPLKGDMIPPISPKSSEEVQLDSMDETKTDGRLSESYDEEKLNPDPVLSPDTAERGILPDATLLPREMEDGVDPALPEA